MSEPNAESARPEITFEQAKEVALRLLSVAPRTRSELLDRLAKRGATTDVAEDAVERMAELGYVDDLAYAEAFVASRRRTKNHGYQRLKMDMIRKGVPADLISAVLENDDDTRQQVAQEFVRVALRKSSSTAPEKLFRRVYNAAMRAGHAPGVVLEVLKAELDQE